MTSPCLSDFETGNADIPSTAASTVSTTCDATDLVPSDPESDAYAPAQPVMTLVKKPPAKRRKRSTKSKSTKLPPDWKYPGARPPLTGFAEVDSSTCTVQPVTAKFCSNYAPPQPVPPPADGYLVCDLFCSIGGISMGARHEGHTVVLAIDSVQERIDVHALNHPQCRHITMELGEAVTNEVIMLINEAVPPDQRHRLWLHLSPPCQMQSPMRAMHNANQHIDTWQSQEDRRAGLALVRWSLDLIVALNPAQFSLEEVSDKDRFVRDLLQEYKRTHPQLLAYDVFDASQYGVPQVRHRAIAARPATIHALQHAPSLKVLPPLSISEFTQLPDGAVYIRGAKNRKLDADRVTASAVRPGLHHDGQTYVQELWLPAPTLCSRPFTWLDAKFQTIRCLQPDESAELMTFPTYFEWPDGMRTQDQTDALGNAVPPMFACRIFRAASTVV